MNSILSISPNNKSLKFLEYRISFNSYRGIHKTQHQRYNLKRIKIILQLLDKYAPNQSKLKIRTTDLSTRPNVLPDEIPYATFCDEVKKNIGIASQDAMRKNIGPDFHRMGLIIRYSKKGDEIDPWKKRPITHFALSDLGKKFICADIIGQSFILSKAINSVMGNLIDILLNILMDTAYSFNKITLTEFMYFISAIDYDKSFEFARTIEEVKELLSNYRALTEIQRRQIDTKLSDDLKPSKFKGNKTNSRDFHNWRNEAMDIFSKLQPTVYFEYREAEGALYLKTAKGEVLESNRLKRSQGEISKYFREHKITKKDGFQLHHIVPLSWAESKEHFVALDKFENMIYIDGYKHGIITVNKNKYVQLNFTENDDVELSDSFNEKIELKNNENVIYSLTKKALMSEYNQTLIFEKI